MSLPIVKALVGRDGCPSGWHAVAPAGYICAGDDATLDENDPIVRALREYGADLSSALPFIYGTVRRPGPIYRKLPTDSELERSEPDLQSRIQAWLMAPGEMGANYAQHVWTPGQQPTPDPSVAWQSHQSDPLPWFLSEGNVPPRLLGKAAADDPLVFAKMEPRVGYSILRTFLHNGRRY
ncbi:MAG TPA: L,D-transpeptidase, partial [Polyangiaceae bacterium]|nr:L,D-transpeptidase [Polyangiaceae bacterium]